MKEMKSGCWDCGATDKELVERPRTAKDGYKNTVDVCEDCLVKWLDKHREFLEFTDKEKEMLMCLLTDENGNVIRP